MTDSKQEKKRKLRVVVVFGGRSSEHEISQQSAASVVKNLDQTRYDVFPIGIAKNGFWYLQDVPEDPLTLGKYIKIETQEERRIRVEPYPEQESGCFSFAKGGKSLGSVDVIFPVIHGPLYEDGALQGLLELLEVPYVGSGVLGSSVGMDKEFSKRIVESHSIKVGPFLCFRFSQWQDQPDICTKTIDQRLQFPVFVKPVNMGSSVGIHKVKSFNELADAIDDAFQYDEKILVEQAIECRELEFAVMEDPQNPSRPKVSVAGEIRPTEEFYSYTAKYMDSASPTEYIIPAELDPDTMAEGQEIAARAFLALECKGLARVDLFFDVEANQLYFNELNTLPGFTTISMYPKMWAASGVVYGQLLDTLIEIAILRHEQKVRLKRNFDLLTQS